MGIAYSRSLVVYSLVRADTSAHLRADIDLNLLAAGWTKIRTITLGFVYEFTSPQNPSLQARVRIQDTGFQVPFGPFTIDVQFMSSDETRIGVLHRIGYGGLFTQYQIIVGICQVFFSHINITADELGPFYQNHSFSGGIPYLPLTYGADCASDAAPADITESWWSSGNRAGSQSFRNCRFCTNEFDFCENGVLVAYTGGNLGAYDNPLRVIPLTPTNDVDDSFSFPPRVIKYNNLRPLYLDPLLAYGTKIRGELWDAFLMSRDRAPVDQLFGSVEFDSFGNTFSETWMSYNYGISLSGEGGGGTWFATIYLLREINCSGVGGTGESNYAY